MPIHVINFALVLKSFVENGCGCFNEDQPGIGVDETVEAKVLAGSFWLEIRFVYDLKKQNKNRGK